MPAFQLTVDCAQPAVLTRLWATALGYEVEAPPAGFGTWNDYWRSVGVPEDELDNEVDAADSLVDPTGQGPRIWFQQVPEAKVVKNRLHLDLTRSGGGTLPSTDPLHPRSPAPGAEGRKIVSARGVAGLHPERS